MVHAEFHLYRHFVFVSKKEVKPTKNTLTVKCCNQDPKKGRDEKDVKSKRGG